MSTDINVLIVDDEKRACTNLRNILVDYVDASLNITGMVNSTYQAEKEIASFNPDAVFLDIDMPHENAFDFLDRIAPINFEVIFVTSYDEYAVKAFKLNAVDYVLKPISILDLRNAVYKLKEKIRFKRLYNSGIGTYTQISGQINNKLIPQKIALKDGSNTELVDFKDIYYIEAQGSYSKFFFSKHNVQKSIVMSNPLSDYEEILPTNIFYRIHRSYLVNATLINNVKNTDMQSVVIKDEISLPVSRRRFASLVEFLKSNEYAYE